MYAMRAKVQPEQKASRRREREKDGAAARAVYFFVIPSATATA